jgi:hypothetical protein
LINSILFLFLKAPITDEELLALSKDLHINDVNGAIVKLDLQGKTTIGDITTDNAPSRYRKQKKNYFSITPCESSSESLLDVTQYGIII